MGKDYTVKRATRQGRPAPVDVARSPSTGNFCRVLPAPDLSTAARLDAVVAEGWALWERFDLEVRTHRFHPFVAADYDVVRSALEQHCRPGVRFLEWGSATGVVTIMADVLGCDAVGIELDGALVRTAREMTARLGSTATFVEGSFVPSAFRARGARSQWTGEGASAYPTMGRALDDFDVVFVFPWDGDFQVMVDIMSQYGSSEALLMLYTVEGRMRYFRGGREITTRQ
jgi:hypothetical protein